MLELAVISTLLIITGTMGADKTGVLGEASDILAQRRIVHAAIDMDTLGVAHLPSAAPRPLALVGSVLPPFVIDEQLGELLL
jgi:hypothetical protein